MTAELEDLLATEPLPSIGGDKTDRGNAIVVAGDPGCPGAALLAATAALRVGAGRVQILTHPSLTIAIGVAVPEAFVLGWDGVETPDDELARCIAEANAVLVGPGLGARAVDTARHLASFVPVETPLVVDAGSLPAIPDLVGHRLIGLPNVEEATLLAKTLGVSDGDQEALTVDLAVATGGVVAVRGPATVLATGERAWRTCGHPALGTAGSGDVLAGLVTGLTARGLEPLVAAAWAIAAHSQAGVRLGGPEPQTAYLASELETAIGAAVEDLSDRLAGAAPESARQ